MVTKMLPARSKVPNSTPKAHSELPKLTKYDKSLIDGWELSLKGRRLSERTPKGSYLPAVELLARWRAGSKKPTSTTSNEATWTPGWCGYRKGQDPPGRAIVSEPVEVRVTALRLCGTWRRCRVRRTRRWRR
jgi:hypothetical protein